VALLRQQAKTKLGIDGPRWTKMNREQPSRTKHVTGNEYLVLGASGKTGSRALLLSSRNLEGNFLFEASMEVAEAALQQSSLEWTIVRANFFMQNFGEEFLLPTIEADRLAVPTGARRRRSLMPMPWRRSPKPRDGLYSEVTETVRQVTGHGACWALSALSFRFK
jgi:hypothetical protein